LPILGCMSVAARVWVWSLGLVLLACDLHLPGQDGDRLRAELNETAVAAFVAGPRDRMLPNGSLLFRAGGIYSSEAHPGPETPWVWQIRHARAEILSIPLTARDRFEGVELSADVLMRFEERYCTLAPIGRGPQRCEPWQDTACCNAVWKRTRGAWVALAPRGRSRTGGGRGRGAPAKGAG
jgi:hypothetical protein